MALRVWLPLNGNLNNQGLTPNIFTGTSITENSSGKIGKCYTFNGSSSKITCASTYKGEDFKYLTIAAWVRVDDTSFTVWRRIGGFNAHTYAHLDINTAGRVRFFCSPDSTTGTSNSPTSTTIIADGKWHHVCGTADETSVKIYVDGTLENTLTRTAVAPAEILTLRIATIDNGSLFLGDMNDFRVYDEALSQQQVKELSKGLVAHYKLNNSYIETVTNLAPGIDGTTSYSTNTSPAWDTTLNGTPMITPNGWVSGYNAGVTNPTQGYHAHWVRENGQWLMMFPNLNSIISQKGRWEGISGNVSTKDILAGEKYTISWWQKTDNLNLAAWGGIYYKKTSDGTMNFWDSCPTLGYNTKLNTWQFMYKTFTRSSEYVQHDGGQSVYVYGGNSNEGTMYVKDVQIVRGDYPLPYTVGTRNGQTYEFDCSGNGYNGKVTGTLKYNIDSPRYEGSTIFTSGLVNSPACAVLANSKDFSINGWFYRTGGATITYYASAENYNTSVDLEGSRYFVYGSNGTAYVGNWTSAANTWQMVTLVHDSVAKTLSLYVNGNYISQVATSGDVYANNTLNIGGRQGSANFAGSISDFRIYATPLSADEILTMYKNSGIIDNKGNTYAYEFKDDTGIVAYDEYATGHTNFYDTFTREIVNDVESPTGKAVKLTCTAIGTQTNRGYYFGGSENAWNTAKNKMEHGKTYELSMYVKMNKTSNNFKMSVECASSQSQQTFNVGTEYKRLVNTFVYNSSAQYWAITNYSSIFAVNDTVYVHSIKIREVNEQPKLNKPGIFKSSGIEENKQAKIYKSSLEANSFIEI